MEENLITLANVESEIAFIIFVHYQGFQEIFGTVLSVGDTPSIKERSTTAGNCNDFTRNDVKDFNGLGFFFSLSIVIEISNKVIEEIRDRQLHCGSFCSCFYCRILPYALRCLSQRWGIILPSPRRPIRTPARLARPAATRGGQCSTSPMSNATLSSTFDTLVSCQAPPHY